MDYTTSANVKAAIHATGSVDDTLLTRLVTAASRAIDRYCTGVGHANVQDYFALADVVDEGLRGFVDVEGRLQCYPHKAVVNSVAALSYRSGPLGTWVNVTSDCLTCQGIAIIAWVDLSRLRGQPLQVQASYNGGFSTSQASLPADLIEAATVLAARYYKEAESGLTDSIGVAELSSLMYTKAMPVRVQQMLSPFQRLVAW